MVKSHLAASGWKKLGCVNSEGFLVQCLISYFQSQFQHVLQEEKKFCGNNFLNPSIFWLCQSNEYSERWLIINRSHDITKIEVNNSLITHSNENVRSD